MELEELIETMEIRMKARDLSDAYLSHVGASTREEIGIGEYAYGITMVPCDWVLPYLKQLEESIPRAVVEEKVKELDKEYTEILKDYGNIDTDVIFNIPNENTRKYLDKLLEKVLVLQEILTKGERK